MIEKKSKKIICPEATPPPDGKTTIDLEGTSQLSKLGRGLKANWEAADPKYWIAAPSHNYQFLSVVLHRMERIMTAQEWKQFQRYQAQHKSILIAANRIRCPYHLAKWLQGRHLAVLKRAEKSAETKVVDGIIERLRKVQSTTLKDLERRMKEPESLTSDEILKIFAGVSRVVTEFETNKGDLGALDMKVIMDVPLSDREAPALDGLDPTLE